MVGAMILYLDVDILDVNNLHAESLVIENVDVVIHSGCEFECHGA